MSECRLRGRVVQVTLTSAPITPSEVRRRYSNGRVLEVVFKKGYRKSGMWAKEKLAQVKSLRGACVPFKKSWRVSECEATHWRSASALHTRFEACAVSAGGDSSGYTDTISCSNAAMMPVARGVNSSLEPVHAS